jgi:alpha-L-rhamnosidase
VLGWYEDRIDPNRKMLGPMPWWSFVDWDTQFPGGVPDGATDGNSSVVTLQYAYTLQQAAELFGYFKDSVASDHYKSLATSLERGTYRQCFDSVRGVMANTPGKNSFSVHANIMAVLTGSVPEKMAARVMDHVLHDSLLSGCTFYYRFYLTRALNKAGMGDLYYSLLGPWRQMIANGLTTFAENPDPTRSDCHAWSASPLYDFFSTICGINPGSPGFATVAIRPALGDLITINCWMPHPNGMIKMDLTRRRARRTSISGEVDLPPGVSGKFYWNGKVKELHPGQQAVNL